MYLSDIHTHSIASGHGTTCTISDMAKAASRKGLKLLGITDHGPGTLAAGTSSYFRSLTYAPKKRFGIELLFGVELNILDIDGHLDLNDELLGISYFIQYFRISWLFARVSPRYPYGASEASLISKITPFSLAPTARVS